jgi:hypothetical protein
MNPSIPYLLQKLDTIENRQPVYEDADAVVSIINASIRGGKSVRNNAIAKGIADPDQQLQKVAATIAALWNAIQMGARDPLKRLTPDRIAALLQTMEVKPQDGPTAAVIDAFAPTGNETKDKWVKALTAYEQAVESGDQEKVQAISSKLVPIITKISNSIRSVTAKALQANKQQGQQPAGNMVGSPSLDFT